ncbi:hypothetical protein IDM40_27685 [Nocardiopsis sp. HNM0947]|uniref:Uncharacterized protein n=1 Tax=Nocardiopsis coralli TaxID=2772213 RepID=A0ABR9PF53_9ACTN|nr:hypothetical protein [Nocardiopsis coralli]MBE3002447.1 hypothetical protein [Nocardiopsis coralli]
MNKTRRWIWAGTAALAITTALAAGLWFGGGPTTRDGWEAASWAAGITAALWLVVTAIAWAATSRGPEQSESSVPSEPSDEPSAKPRGDGDGKAPNPDAAEPPPSPAPDGPTPSSHTVNTISGGVHGDAQAIQGENINIKSTHYRGDHHDYRGSTFIDKPDRD